MATIAIDATYAVDERPTGVAVYSRRLIESLAELDSPHRLLIGYRASRWRRRKQFLRFTDAMARGSSGKPAVSTFLFQDPWTFWLPWRAGLFHSLAQRPAPFHFRSEVVTILDIFPLTRRSYSTPDFQRKFSRLLIEAASRAARIITPSEYTAGEIVRSLGVAREKIRVIPLGVTLPEPLSEPPGSPRQREYWVGKGNELILVVGVIQTRKNTLGAVRALERLPERYRMVLVGGNGHGNEAVHEYICKAGLRERVKIAGYVSADQVASLYRAASVLLFSSFDEGFGLPVLEAMAYGLPVVASSASSLPEVGGDAALYVDPNDDAAMAATLSQAVEDQSLRSNLIQKGLARARKFSWRRTAEETLRVYDEVLASNP